MTIADRFGKITIGDKQYLLIEEAVLESMLKENTLNRDKVMEIVIEQMEEGAFGSHVIDHFAPKLTNAISSLSLPALSEGEMDELFPYSNDSSGWVIDKREETNDTIKESAMPVIEYNKMQKYKREGFEAAIKYLTKPKEE